jgi:hypothetical protein
MDRTLSVFSGGQLPVDSFGGQCPLARLEADDAKSDTLLGMGWDMAADSGADDAVDMRWMTYAELAGLRGISKAGAARIVRRKKWRKQADNQGYVRVLVPFEADNATQESPVDHVHTVSALKGEMAVLRERAEEADKRADKAEKLVDQAEARANAAEARAEAAELTVEALRRAEVARVADQAIREEAERPKIVAAKLAEAQLRSLQKANDARRALSRWARLRAAWRGE